MVELLDEQIEHLKKLGYEDPPKTADLSPERLDKLRIRWSYHKHLSNEEIENRAVCQAVWEQRTSTPLVDANQAPVDNLFALARKLDGIAETIRSNKYPDARPEINHVKEAVQDCTLTLNHISEEAETRDINSLEISRQIGAGIENAVRSELQVSVLNPTDLAPILKFMKILAGIMIWMSLLLMVIIGLSLRAHGQYSRINSIAFQNAGTPITGGYFTYPFTFNFVGCTGATSGSTLTLTCSGSGVGTVTQVNPATGAGTITNLGTFGFSSQTSTPTLTIGLTTAAAHTFFGNNTGSTAAHNYLRLACADLSDAGTGCTGSTSSGGTVTSVATTTPITGGTITGTGTIACATCVTSSSPGVGLAHFAGSTQAVTSAAVNLASADVTGNLPAANLAAGTLATGMAAATGASIGS